MGTASASAACDPDGRSRPLTMSSHPHGRWPAGLIGMLALVFSTERYVARHDTKFTTLPAAAWKRSGEDVPKAARVEVVALGDSLVKHGVVSPVLAARAGRSVYNLAAPGSSFAVHHALLARLLRSGARPSAALIDGEALTNDPLVALRVWSELATLAESAGLARVSGDADVLTRAVLSRVLPSCKDREELRFSITSTLAGKLVEQPRALPVYWRNWNKNGGGEVLQDPNFSAGDSREAQLEQTGYRPVHWLCHPINDVYVTRFLDLAEAHGIPVFWLLPPYLPDVQRRREQYGMDGKYMAYVRSLHDRYLNMTVVDGRHAGYPAETVADLTHLSRLGAITFSDTLGGIIRDRLAAGARIEPRWVELPHFDAASASALASASDVEDVKQSGVALSRVMAAEHQKRRERQIGLNANAVEKQRRR